MKKNMKKKNVYDRFKTLGKAPISNKDKDLDYNTNPKKSPSKKKPAQTPKSSK